MSDSAPELFASLQRPPRRPGRWLRRLRILFLLAVLVVVSAGSAVLRVANDPALIQELVRRAVDDPGLTVDFQDLVIDPTTGRITIFGIYLAHTDRGTPQIHISRLSVSFP